MTSFRIYKHKPNLLDCFFQKKPKRQKAYYFVFFNARKWSKILDNSEESPWLLKYDQVIPKS